MTDILEHRALSRLTDFEARWRSDSPPTKRAPTPMGYQPGLDGLRAVSVVAVILYHAGFTWMHGGFLGVEVFFVVSGFLITSLLLEERERTAGVRLNQFLAAAGATIAPGAVRRADRGWRVDRVVRHGTAAVRYASGPVARPLLLRQLGADRRRGAVLRQLLPRCGTCGASPSRSSGTCCGRWPSSP